MTTEQSFNCIFCKETFSNKEELQIHFRKHGDPEFGKKCKSVIDTLNINDKSTDDNELVGCDVCEEVFPTISKAITHKHKMHPDQDTKYFCPFCGKLFTMKHLYNKHIQTNHESEEVVDTSEFQCHCCGVFFYSGSAMMYHNKFFHRQDTDLPSIGQSKKLKRYSEDLLQIYYCSFCGEEFNNKVNLHKHIKDDHGDENQSPTEVLKCPLCEAVFYHLDAYELHLMFHSPEDLYSERNHLVEDVEEFSLETVPPIMEKVEEEQEPENVGIGDFLQLVMGDTVENEGKVKLKKHKKHKKSKKAAITLDEFLNMNKDVFGDGLDIQGIEEVPSRAVLKKFKSKKLPNLKTKAINADLEKLQKQGIIVKGKSVIKPVNCKISKSIRKNDEIEKTTNAITAPDDVLSKLMRQSNSQIKIIKKSVSQNENVSPIQGKSRDFNNESNNSNINSDSPPDDTTSALTNAENNTEDNDDTQDKSDIEDNHDNIDGTADSSSEQNETNLNSFDTSTTTNEKNSNSPNSIDKGISDSDNIDVSLKYIGNTKQTSSDTSVTFKDGVSVTDDVVTENVFEETKETTDVEKSSSKGAINALKHLSHLITIKPVIKKSKTLCQTNTDTNDEFLQSAEELPCDKVEKAKMADNVFKAPESIPKRTVVRQNTKVALKSSQTLKSLGEHLKVSTSKESDDLEDEQDDCDEPVHSEIYKIIKSENKIPISNKEDTSFCNEDYGKSQLQTKQTNTELLSRLTNVTAKAIPSKSSPINTPTTMTANLQNTTKNLEKKNVIDETIEIFNIDDSDSEHSDSEDVNYKKDMNPTNVQTSSDVKNVLNNLSKNITVKSSQQNKNMNEISNKQLNEEKQSMTSKEYTKVKMHSSEIQKSINLQNTLKNLGSNITVKSNNSFPIQSEDENRDFEDNNEGDRHYDSDQESIEGATKITEITEDMSDIDYESNDESNVFVQSPENDNVEQENISFDDENEFSDFESQIQANTLKKPQLTKLNSVDSIKNCNKEITIKPISERTIINEEVPSASNIKETSIKPKLSSNIVSIKPYSQVSNPSTSMNQKSSTSNEVNTVKTVKKFQTETVIQEITTVTRTIRTVNESTNEVVQSQESAKPLKIMNKNQPGKEYHGRVVQHAAPTVGTKVRGTSPMTAANTIRPSNQIVPIRNAANYVRSPMPGTQVIRKTPPSTSSSQKPIIGKLKISPHLINQNKKRLLQADSSNCKKLKLASNFSHDMSPIKNYDNAVEQYSIASTSQSSFSNTRKIVKGNSLIMTSQTQSEVCTNTQEQLNKLGGMSGLKIVKSSTKQSMHVEEKNEVSAPKRNTLEALEKLQKQGLLVKKPRIELNEESYDSFSESDGENYEQ